MRSKVVPRRKPLPTSPFLGSVGFQLCFLRETVGTLAHEIPSILVVVATVVTAGAESVLWLGAGLVLHQFLNRPPKATRIIGIDGFKNEENRANFEEDNGPNK